MGQPVRVSSKFLNNNDISSDNMNIFWVAVFRVTIKSAGMPNNLNELLIRVANNSITK